MKFEVDGVEYEMVQSPTFGEAKAIEKVTGRAFASLSEEKNQPIDVMQALIWVSMKRVNPEITFDDLDDLDMGVLGSMQTEPEAEAPKDDA